MNRQIRLVHRIDDIAPDAWNALAGFRYPFLRHEFLSALEATDCLGERTGWLPCHLAVVASGTDPVAAIPLYLKLNSFGEFVFDWAWADAYRRAGLDYYPKLVAAVPFTPATAPKILQGQGTKLANGTVTAIDAAIETAKSLEVSSLHWLFTPENRLPGGHGMLTRVGCQFHWENQGYEDFDHFLARFKSKKRKQIGKERREVADAGIRLERIAGSEVTPAEWAAFHELYRGTFVKYGNYPALTLAFFEAIARTMGDQVLLVLARLGPRIVGAAYFLVGADTLYGRYWGCNEAFSALHFEACYYQGIEYCIEKRLDRFEPGAQGEHKISRGFLPTTTWSHHWIADPRFRSAIGEFVSRETRQMQRYMTELRRHAPFREGPP